jgi:hypothetical protein
LIPGALREYADGHPSVEIKGRPATLEEVLNSLWKLHSRLRGSDRTEKGQVREHINIFIGNDHIRDHRLVVTVEQQLALRMVDHAGADLGP